ncbi:MAG TPA: FtsX-like permease family protein, partial [Amaricoccus sp.]|nr:FtsX-like permease family protein [Amaricoccus sp.]
AERLLARPGRLSRMLAPAEITGRALPPGLADRLVVRPPGGRGDIERLSASFHLNLAAFGALAFVVGLFIVYGAAGLAFERRRPQFRTLRACGVSARGLVAALSVELALLALLGGAAGMVGGYLLAAALLPDVAASLGGLYGARLPDSLALGPSWWAAGLGMALAGTFAAGAQGLARAARMPILATAHTEAWRTAGRRSRRRAALLAALVALGAAAALAFGRGLPAGFAALAGLLLAAALALPAALDRLVALGGRTARGPLAGWFWADVRQGVGPLGLALAALLLALAVNIGVGTMVESFRRTFLGYLDQRLAAELYVGVADAAEAGAVADWLATRPQVAAVLPVRNATTRVADWPVEVVGFRDHATYRDTWPLLAAAPDAWDRVARGEAGLVSEQLARRFGLWPGATLTLPTPAGDWSLPVAGVYADYGNAEGQAMVAGDALAARWPDGAVRRLLVRTPPDAVPRLAADLRAALALPEAQVVDQRGLKAASRRVFEQTFAVTVALNGLTLAVAGIALLTSLLTLADARLIQVAPLWAGGVPRRRLAALELVRALGLAALTALLALPLGLALAWMLTDVVNVRAFGWRLPVLLLPGRWAATLTLALVTAALAALWPALRLARVPPRRLLEEFAGER